MRAFLLSFNRMRPFLRGSLRHPFPCTGGLSKLYHKASAAGNLRPELCGRARTSVQEPGGKRAARNHPDRLDERMCAPCKPRNDAEGPNAGQSPPVRLSYPGILPAGGTRRIFRLCLPFSCRFRRVRPLPRHTQKAQPQRPGATPAEA